MKNWNQQPRREEGYIDVHFPFLALQNKSAKQALSVSAGIFKGLSSKRVTDKMQWDNDIPPRRGKLSSFPLQSWWSKWKETDSIV